MDHFWMPIIASLVKSIMASTGFVVCAYAWELDKNQIILGALIIWIIVLNLS